MAKNQNRIAIKLCTYRLQATTLFNQYQSTITRERTLYKNKIIYNTEEANSPQDITQSLSCKQK